MIRKSDAILDDESAKTVRPRPPLLRASGADDPPVRVEINDATYHRAEIYKHDSWAATARYMGGQGSVVCKFHRRQPIFRVPMKWFGNLVARHETDVFRRLDELPNIPSLTGVVHVNGVPLANAVAHEFVPGEPLQHDRSMDEDFLVNLQELLSSIHDRGVAYCDLHKRENVLVGDDGEPYLIDFQISYVVSDSRFARLFLSQSLLGILQRSDNYHLQKHIDRCRPHLLSTPEQRPWPIRLHRLVAVPFRTVRRRLLVALGVRGQSGYCDSEHAPEHALRKRPKAAA